MSMEITNDYSNYATSSTNTTKNSKVTTSTVEMKTSTSGITRTEQIKTGYSNVDDYSKYLQSKYRYMNTGAISMYGVPTTVSVSSSFLRKCMNDPEKAKYLEENLAAIPDSILSSKSCCAGKVVNESYTIDANGNISATVTLASGNGSDKVDEQEEKAAKRRAEKKAEEEKAAKRRAEKKVTEEVGKETGEYTISAMGTDIKAVTQKMISASLGISAPTGVSFDIKA